MKAAWPPADSPAIAFLPVPWKRRSTSGGSSRVRKVSHCGRPNLGSARFQFRIEGALTARHDHVDRFVTKVAIDVGFGDPVADRSLVAAAVEEVERAARVAVCRVQHGDRYVSAHGR